MLQHYSTMMRNDNIIIYTNIWKDVNETILFFTDVVLSYQLDKKYG